MSNALVRECVHLLDSGRVVTGIKANEHSVSRAEDIGKGLQKASGVAPVEVACRRGRVRLADQGQERTNSPTLEPRLKMHFCREALAGSLSQIRPSS